MDNEQDFDRDYHDEDWYATEQDSYDDEETYFDGYEEYGVSPADFL